MKPSDDSRFTLLIVDDSRFNLELMAALFEDDYQVKVASNGIRALDIAQSLPPPDLILLDVVMPEMDGYEVCRRLQANPLTRSIPIIFVTAATDSAAESYGLSLGAVNFITKPVDPLAALQAVRHQLRFK